ncbi:DUF4238 domain-containing protein [Leucobacter sp. UT-8R-CII-1-4]|nr:DUF4238 domain-containing protein [Leucobacter sp. UT-8R-CII-1-4]MDI6023154.1 DUF4238 domain-containing protein [Leucobacter sp. UT-8R-CII-1-4]
MPRMLLRGFATDKDLICAVRLPGDTTFTATTKSVAAKKHLYSVDAVGQAPDAFEKILSEVEGDASRIIRQVIEGRTRLTEEDRNGLAFFIALQAARGPEMKRSMEHVASEALRMQIGAGGKPALRRRIAESQGREATDAEVDALWDRVMEPGATLVSMTNLKFVKQIVMTAEQLLPYISGRPWTVHRFEQRSLIVSDSPVGLIPHPDDDDDPWGGTGFMTAWGITFPLSRKVGILMSDPMVFADLVPVERVRAGHFDQTMQGTAAVEKLFNEMTVRGAREWIYHHPDDAKFVPDDLPEPDPLSFQFVGDRIEFSGEPIFLQPSPAE